MNASKIINELFDAPNTYYEQANYQCVKQHETCCGKRLDKLFSRQLRADLADYNTTLDQARLKSTQPSFQSESRELCTTPQNCQRLSWCRSPMRMSISGISPPESRPSALGH
jgi:hypothetical protein